MKIRSHIIFWTVIYVLFILMYKNAFESYQLSIYFASFLFPIGVGSSLTFNYLLVPKYLLPRKFGRFVLYLLYTLIASAYLVMIAIFVAFIFLAELNINTMNPMILDVFEMTIMIYSVVLAHGFVLTLKKYSVLEQALEEAKSEGKKNKVSYLLVKSERQNKRIDLDKLLYVESLSDYIKFHIEGQDPIISKQKISTVKNELPSNFLRIHRSFIVNLDKIDSFNAESVNVLGQELNISRTYKKDVQRRLTKEV